MDLERVDRLLRSFEIARIAADPPKGSELAVRPGGWSGISYWRLHGTPKTYYSNYEENWLQVFAEKLRKFERQSASEDSWIIFDNTALGHATANAIWLQKALIYRKGD
jgi:uncharacterized protein YecE (DUF72 family)